MRYWLHHLPTSAKIEQTRGFLQAVRSIEDYRGRNMGQYPTKSCKSMEAATVHSTSPASLVPDESSICWASLDSARIRSLEPLLPLIPGTLSKYKRSSSCLTIFCTFLSTTSSSCSLKPFEHRLQHQLAILKSLLYTVSNIKLLLSKASCTPATTSSCFLPKRSPDQAAFISFFFKSLPSLV